MVRVVWTTLIIGYFTIDYQLVNFQLRNELLDSYLFSSIQEVLTTTEKFQHNYNHNRPHGSLNDLPPDALKEHRNNYKHASTTQSL